MIVVVAYDVSTESKQGRRRLRRIAQVCKDYGQRVQKSVFECVLREVDWLQLRQRLLEEVSLEEDSLRIYFLDEESRRKTKHYGKGRPVDLEGPLIV